MRPILFEWRGIKFHSYPTMLYLGMVFGIITANFVTHLTHLDSARVFVAMILLTVPGLVGARFLFVATHWKIYRLAPNRIWRQSEGGAAMLGGFLLMIVFSLPLLSVLMIPIAEFWDVATFSLLIGLSCTRLGCLLHGCCSGRETGAWFALNLPDYRGVWRRRVPSQLLEAGLGVLLFLAAMILWNQRPFPGAIFLLTIVGYSFGRFILEPMRDAPDKVRNWNVHQVLSGIIGIAALVGFLVARLGTH